MKTLFGLICCTLLAAVSAPVHAEPPVVSKTISYKDGEVELEGVLVMPAKPSAAKIPGVLLVHDWTGVQDYARSRAAQLAQLGYAAFCADIYGKGIRPNDPKECSAEAGKYKTNRVLFRQRLNLALDAFKTQPGIDASRLAAIGYCFGGLGVIELARSGADVKGVVSFHGALDAPAPTDGSTVKAKVLILHGAEDPFVPEKDIKAFVTDMNTAKVDWQMVYYSGAVHSFTKPAAGSNKASGSAYDEKADRRSWKAMDDFLQEVLSPTPGH